MTTDETNVEQLQAENAGLRARLEEAEETLRAIREGEVDAVIVSGSKGDRVFALSEADSLPRLMIETMNEAGLAVTPDGSVVFSNGRMGVSLGRFKGALLGHNLADFVAPSDVQAFRQLLRSSASSMADARIAFVSSSGEEVPMHVWSSQLDRPEGPLICLVCTDLSRVEHDQSLIAELGKQKVQLRESRKAALHMMEDAVAARQQTEAAAAALRKSEERYRLLGETMLQGVVHQGADGQIVAMNPAAERILGKTREQFVGSSSVKEEHDTIREDGTLFPGTEHPAMVSLRTGETIRGVVMGVFNPKLGAYRWINIDAVPVMRPGETRPGEVYTVFEDITARKAGEDALHQSEERYRLLAENTEDFVELSDPVARRALYISPSIQRRLGVTAEEITAGTGPNIVHPDDLAAVDKAYALNIAGQSTTIEYRNRCKDGTWIWLEGRCTPIKDADGRVTSLLLVSRDITERKRNEAALRDSEERYRLLSDYSEDLISLINADSSRVLYRSPSFKKVTGWTNEEMEANDWHTRTHPDDWAEAERVLEAQARGQTTRHEYRMRCKDGHWIWLESIVRPIPGPDGRVEKKIRTSRDITERKLAELALREREEQLRLFVEHAPASLAMFDTQMRYLAVSQRWLDDFGLTGRDIAGRSHYELFPEITDAWREVHRRSLAGEVMRAEEDRFVRANGSEQWLRWEVRPWHDAGGQVAGIVIFSEDITERKLADEALRHSEARFRAAFDSSAVAMSLTSPEGRLLKVNAAFSEMTGYAEAELLRLAFYDFTHPDDLPLNREVIQEMLDGKRPSVHMEKRYIHKDGHVIWGDMSSAVVRDDAGRPLYMITHVQDITARKQREVELQQLNRALRALSESDKALVRAKDEAEYLAAACRIVVEDCGHAMVWIGYADDNPEKTVRPVAHAGFDQGYIDKLKITWADTERGRGPTGTAIRTGRITGCRYMLTDPAFAPWRDEAIQRGYASSIVLPLMEAGKAFGAISIYSRESDPFTKQETRILADLTADLAGGILRLRAREAQRHAEEALRASEAQFRLLFDSNPNPMWVFDEETLGFIAVNETALRHYGYTRDEFLAMSVLDIRPPDERDEARAIIDRQKGQIEVRIGVRRHQKKDGALIDVELTVSSIPFNGRPGRLVLVNDVTERLQIEAQAAVQLSALKSTANAIVITDGKGMIEWVNPAFEHLTGYSAAEAIGQNPRVLNSGRHDKAFFKDMWDTVLAGQVWHGELVNKRKDGVLYTEEMTITPVPDSSGRLAHFVAVKQDVTQRKHAEDQMRLHLAVLQSAAMGILIVSPKGEIQWVNESFTRLTGYSADEIIGQNPRLLKSGRQDREFYGNLWKTIRSGRVWRGELVNRRKDGNHYHEEMVITPFINKHGEVTHFIATKHDITERKRSEQYLKRTLSELARSNEELEQFAYVASHDLQEPLRAVTGYLGLLEHELKDRLDEKERHHITGAVDGARRMHTLIADLLSLSRVGTRGGEFEWTDMNTLLDEAQRALSVTIKETGAQIIPTPLPTLKVDAGQIALLFQNLIGNAIKFRSARTPEIHITAERRADVWQFSIRDNGIGIERQHFDRIFVIFQRLHTRKQYPGTGIGLAICKKIVERHSGKIWVDSEPDKGTTFFFSLPAQRDDDAKTKQLKAATE